MKNLYIIPLLIVSFLVKSQENRFYTEAYQNIYTMLKDEQPYSFKNAVFSVENAYYQGKLDTVQLNRKINF